MSNSELLSVMGDDSTSRMEELCAFFTSLSTLASMAQQLHTYLRWTSTVLEQFDHVKLSIGNSELAGCVLLPGQRDHGLWLAFGLLLLLVILEVPFDTAC